MVRIKEFTPSTTQIILFVFLVTVLAGSVLLALGKAVRYFDALLTEITLIVIANTVKLVRLK